METGEYYYTALRDRVSAEFMVVATTRAGLSTLPSSVLEFDTQAIADCPGKSEFYAAIHKRFKTKRSGKGVRDPDCVVLWCLCTKGYKVHEKSVSELTNSEVSTSWEFIDSMKKSSTKQLSAWVSNMAASRSSEGFKAAVADAYDADRPAVVYVGSLVPRHAGVRPVEILGHDHALASVRACIEHDVISFATDSLRVRGSLPRFMSAEPLQSAQGSRKRVPGPRLSNVEE